MRSIVLAILLSFVAAACEAARPVVVVQTAQDAAIVMARRGVLVHSGCGCYEGIGFSTTSPDDAIRRSCYWGQRRPKEIATARGPRGWYAVVRYW
jgi:hypothetical protein